MSHGIVVTEGSGHIGSHVVSQLGDVGEPVQVIDNLSTGLRPSVLRWSPIVGETGGQEAVATEVACEARVSELSRTHIDALTCKRSAAPT